MNARPVVKGTLTGRVDVTYSGSLRSDEKAFNDFQLCAKNQQKRLALSTHKWTRQFQRDHRLSNSERKKQHSPQSLVAEPRKRLRQGKRPGPEPGPGSFHPRSVIFLLRYRQKQTIQNSTKRGNNEDVIANSKLTGSRKHFKVVPRAPM